MKSSIMKYRYKIWKQDNFDADITYSTELLKLITKLLWTKYSTKRISGGTKNFFDEESH